MSERAMAAWKVLGMVLLVVLPGGSLVLLGIAAYKAWQKRAGPFALFNRAALQRAWTLSVAWLARWLRLPSAWARA